MATIKVTIQDDLGNAINEAADKEYPLDLGKATLAEIEGAVEEFKKKAFADIEKDLLLATQASFVEEQNKEECSSVMERPQSLSRRYIASSSLPFSDLASRGVRSATST
jgi:hypothetical protein